MNGSSELVGYVLDGKYRLDQPLGSGGMGAVYRATHLGTDRTVAVKVIVKRFGESAEFVERFRREAQAAGRLRHPNVVDVTDFGFADVDGRRVAYLVMEYLDGCSLSEVLKEERSLPLRWVVDILDQVGSAVHEAHQQGIVHRDLKPDNLWLEPDRRGGFRIKVLDFGLAKLAEPTGTAESAEGIALPPDALAAATQPTTTTRAPASGDPEAGIEDAETRVQPARADRAEQTAGPHQPRAGDLTQAGDVLGTPLYMSPEQCRGEALDARSDIYSLAVISFQMLTGRPPFEGDVKDVLRKHREEDPPPLRRLRRDLPRSVADLIASALAKDPAKRPATAVAFTVALRARAERPLEFLRNVQTLIAERQSLFLRISLLTHAPLIVLGLVVLALATAFPPLALHALVLPATLLTVLLVLFALVTAAAFYETVVIQALAAPMRTILLRPLAQALRHQFPVYLRTMAPFYIALAAVLLPLVFTPKSWRVVLAVAALPAAIWLVAQSDAFWFAAEVVSLEGLAGSAALKRARALARRSRRDIPVLQNLGYAATALAVLVATAFSLGSSQPLGHSVADVSRLLGPLGWLGAQCALFAPVSVFVLPFVVVPQALLYFRAREAGGEPLPEMLAHFDQRIWPAGSWQSRVKDRLRSEIASRR